VCPLSLFVVHISIYVPEQGFVKECSASEFIQSATKGMP
jgi:hypothetical protein